MPPDETLLDAISKAVEPEGEKPTEPAEEEAEETEVPEKDGAADERTPVGEEETQTAEEKAAAEAAAETPEAKAAAEAKAAETATAATQKAEEKAATEAAAKKAADPVNDPIPPTVSERTRERITSLVNMVKERDTQVAQGNELFQSIASTGASAEELGQMLTYMRLIHSDNIEDKRRAYETLKLELEGLAPLIGEVVPGKDPLEGHQDLQDAVAAQSMRQEHAEELARGRAREKARTTAQQQQSTAQQTEQQQTAARQTAIQELNALEAALKSDPDYARKYAVLVPALKPVLARLPPTEWRATFEHAYRELKLGPVVQAAAPQKPGQQPLRPNKQPSGSSAKAPSSLLEAMNAGLESMRS